MLKNNLRIQIQYNLTGFCSFSWILMCLFAQANFQDYQNTQAEAQCFTAMWFSINIWPLWTHLFLGDRLLFLLWRFLCSSLLKFVPLCFYLWSLELLLLLWILQLLVQSWRLLRKALLIALSLYYTKWMLSMQLIFLLIALSPYDTEWMLSMQLILGGNPSASFLDKNQPIKKW